MVSGRHHQTRNYLFGKRIIYVVIQLPLLCVGMIWEENLRLVSFTTYFVFHMFCFRHWRSHRQSRCLLEWLYFDLTTVMGTKKEGRSNGPTPHPIHFQIVGRKFTHFWLSLPIQSLFRRSFLDELDKYPLLGNNQFLHLCLYLSLYLFNLHLNTFLKRSIFPFANFILHNLTSFHNDCKRNNLELF